MVVKEIIDSNIKSKDSSLTFGDKRIKISMGCTYCGQILKDEKGSNVL